MKKIIGNPWLIELPRMVLGIFVVLNIIAMLSYPGGTYLDDAAVGYSFTRNFLSDLGRTLSYPGEVNFLSAQLFNMTKIPNTKRGSSISQGLSAIFFIYLVPYINIQL